MKKVPHLSMVSLTEQQAQRKPSMNASITDSFEKLNRNYSNATYY